jgi:hypothetical protein
MWSGRILQRSGQKCAAQGKRLVTMTVRQEAKMPNLDESPRQNVQEESPDEFDGIQSHQLLPVSVGGVSPAKCNLTILQANQPAIRDGHPVCIAGEVFDNVFRAIEWPASIDDPGLATELTNKPIECRGVFPSFEGAGQM